MRYPFLSLFLFSIIGFLLISCGTATIEGEVYDHTGVPLSNVTITVDKTDVTSVSDSQGRYLLQVSPGELYNLILIKDGYTKSSISIGAPKSNVTYKAPRATLYKLPEKKGIYLITQTGYSPINKVPIVRKKEDKKGDELVVNYCVEAEPSVIEGPRVEFFNYQDKSLSFFKIGPNKCFYKINETKKQEWFIRIKTRIRDVGDVAKIHNVTLEYGDYIFAETEEKPVGPQGYFVSFPAPPPEPED